MYFPPVIKTACDVWAFIIPHRILIVLVQLCVYFVRVLNFIAFVFSICLFDCAPIFLQLICWIFKQTKTNPFGIYRNIFLLMFSFHLNRFNSIVSMDTNRTKDPMHFNESVAVYSKPAAIENHIERDKTQIKPADFNMNTANG